MSEESQKQIEKLERENKVVRMASQQWEHLQKVYQESIEKFQLIEKGEIRVEAHFLEGR